MHIKCTDDLQEHKWSYGAFFCPFFFAHKVTTATSQSFIPWKQDVTTGLHQSTKNKTKQTKHLLALIYSLYRRFFYPPHAQTIQTRQVMLSELGGSRNAIDTEGENGRQRNRKPARYVCIHTYMWNQILLVVWFSTVSLPSDFIKHSCTDWFSACSPAWMKRSYVIHFQLHQCWKGGASRSKNLPWWAWNGEWLFLQEMQGQQTINTNNVLYPYWHIYT